MLTKRDTLLIFPTRLTTFTVDAAPLDAALRALVLERSTVVPTVARGERTGWQSDDDFFRWSTETRALGAHVAEAVLAAHGQPVGDVALFGWANLLTRGAYFNPHAHADAAWSGVYYVDAGDSDPAVGGVLMFRDPRAGAGMVIGEGNAFDSATSYQLTPRTGELVIFPAWLLHWVTPYQSDRPRISVSFNAR